MSNSNRLRITYAALAVGTILIGMVVHFKGHALAASVRDVAGDALWAFMIACWISAVFPLQRIIPRAAIALSVCFAVEYSQLWHAPMLDQLRMTTIGALVLGSGFDVRDLGAYALGILLFASLDQRLVLQAIRKRQ